MGYILTLLLLSCGGDATEELPADILEREALIPVLVDLQILESHYQRQFARVDLYRDALDSSSLSIFADHGISKDQFTTSLDYYSTQPDTLFIIYEAALDSIKFRMNANNVSEDSELQ
ncbi:MAG: DUF4296 domain-containing protein [Crocinitomix sp.]|nr:DUF4296 domain-containing protein [Crocinitomix sp.]